MSKAKLNTSVTKMKKIPQAIKHIRCCDALLAQEEEDALCGNEVTRRYGHPV